MSVTSVDKDYDKLTFTMIADFATSPDRVWDLFADPRKLERWWGPPTYPATVKQHDLTPGGDVTYYMTGPEGDRHGGYWRILAADAPKSLEFIDGFADLEGKPDENLPASTVHVRLTERPGGTRMEMRSVFDSREQMEQAMNMGTAEGMQQAVSQMDALLAA